MLETRRRLVDRPCRNHATTDSEPKPARNQTRRELLMFWHKPPPDARALFQRNHPPNGWDILSLRPLDESVDVVADCGLTTDSPRLATHDGSWPVWAGQPPVSLEPDVTRDREETENDGDRLEAESHRETSTNLAGEPPARPEPVASGDRDETGNGGELSDEDSQEETSGNWLGESPPHWDSSTRLLTFRKERYKVRGNSLALPVLKSLQGESWSPDGVLCSTSKRIQDVKRSFEGLEKKVSLKFIIETDSTQKMKFRIAVQPKDLRGSAPTAP